MQYYAEIASWAILGDPDKPYKTSDIRQFEVELLQVIDWDAEISTAYFSQKRLSMLAGLKDSQVQIFLLTVNFIDIQCHMVRYLLELSLLAADMVTIRPSIITSAAVLVAKTYYGHPLEWNDNMVYHRKVAPHQYLERRLAH